MDKTQKRLTTGLKVSSAIDNAVAYFKSKSLDDRAADFTDRKDEIDQGISSIKASINGTTVADSILKQMKGIVNSARTATASTRATLTSQFQDLAKQLNSAMSDSSYQGLNLINNSSQSLTVYFNQGTNASLTVNSQDLNASVLLTAATANAASAGVLTVMMSQAGFSVQAGFSALSDAASAATILDNLSQQMDSSINTVRAAASRLGGSVTFLTTRLDFTKNYVETLNEGRDKLTLADLNEEGSNLQALQTRNQIGIQSLSIAGQQSQSILSLLR